MRLGARSLLEFLLTGHRRLQRTATYNGHCIIPMHSYTFRLNWLICPRWLKNKTDFLHSRRLRHDETRLRWPNWVLCRAPALYQIWSARRVGHILRWGVEERGDAPPSYARSSRNLKLLTKTWKTSPILELGKANPQTCLFLPAESKVFSLHLERFFFSFSFLERADIWHRAGRGISAIWDRNPFHHLLRMPFMVCVFDRMWI